MRCTPFPGRIFTVAPAIAATFGAHAPATLITSFPVYVAWPPVLSSRTCTPFTAPSAPRVKPCTRV